jgi:hypothetical protein
LAVLAQTAGPVWEMKLAAPLRRSALLAILGRTPIRAFVVFALAMALAYAACGGEDWGWYFYATVDAWCVGVGLVRRLIESRLRARPPAYLASARASAFALTALAIAASAVFAWRTTDLVTPNVYRPMREWDDGEDLAAAAACACSPPTSARSAFSAERPSSTPKDWCGRGQGRDAADRGAARERADYVVCVVNAMRLTPFLGDPISQRYEPIQRFAPTDPRAPPDTAASPTPGSRTTWSSGGATEPTQRSARSWSEAHGVARAKAHLARCAP